MKPTSETDNFAVNPDVASAAKQWSKVNNFLPHKMKTVIIVSIGIFLLLIGFKLLATKMHPQLNNTANPTLQHLVDYQTELQANLAHLHQEIKPLVAATLPKPELALETDSALPAPRLELSKAYLARRNAPTNLFSAPSPYTQENPETLSATSTRKTNNTLPFAGEGNFQQFGNQNTTASTVTATKILHPEVTIASGEMIHGILETAINSDLPGMVRAFISQPVYAYVGARPLIPAGSRALGQYASTVLQGQNRIFIVWNRIILPNGISIQLNSPGADELGRAGMAADDIDHHFFARFGEAALLSIIGAGAQNYGVNNTDQYNSAALYRAALGQSFQQTAQQSLQTTNSIQPTLKIAQGNSIIIFVAHDLNFYSAINPQLAVKQV